MRMQRSANEPAPRDPRQSLRRTGNRVACVTRDVARAPTSAARRAIARRGRPSHQRLPRFLLSSIVSNSSYCAVGC